VLELGSERKDRQLQDSSVARLISTSTNGIDITLTLTALDIGPVAWPAWSSDGSYPVKQRCQHATRENHEIEEDEITSRRNNTAPLRAKKVYRYIRPEAKKETDARTHQE
jgi:hypothetical protein